MLVRLVLAIFLTAATLFCVFGLLATLEPIPAVTQWSWRGIYGLILVGNIAGLIHLIRGMLRR